MPNVHPSELSEFTAQILNAAGAKPDYAEIVATHLVDANLAGHDSHGVIRTPYYLRSIEKGELHPCAKPEIVQETASMAQICGHWTFAR